MHRHVEPSKKRDWNNDTVKEFFFKPFCISRSYFFVCRSFSQSGDFFLISFRRKIDIHIIRVCLHLQFHDWLRTAKWGVSDTRAAINDTSAGEKYLYNMSKSSYSKSRGSLLGTSISARHVQHFKPWFLQKHSRREKSSRQRPARRDHCTIKMTKTGIQNMKWLYNRLPSLRRNCGNPFDFFPFSVLERPLISFMLLDAIFQFFCCWCRSCDLCGFLLSSREVVILGFAGVIFIGSTSRTLIPWEVWFAFLSYLVDLVLAIIRFHVSSFDQEFC